MSECKASATEVEKLEAMLESFSNPKDFAYHVGKDLLVNGISIYRDIKGAIEAY